MPSLADVSRTFKDRNILITGAAGFIGGNLAASLSRTKCRLMLVDSNPRLVNVPLDGAACATLHKLSICDDAFLGLITTTPLDYIFHFAGNANVAASVVDPALDFEVNLRAGFRLLEALRTSRSETHLLYASSAAVYGNPSRLPIREHDPTVPISPYGVGKLAMERYVAVFCDLYGLRGTSVRMFSPFGPRLQKQIVFELIRKLLADPTSLELLGDGTQTRDFLFVDDLVSALLHVAAFGETRGSVYNIASGTSTAVSSIAAQLNDIMGLRATIRFRRQAMLGYPDHWQADISRLEALGWQPTVPLRTGLATTAEWVKHEYPQH